jgi:hypothetical protein
MSGTLAATGAAAAAAVVAPPAASAAVLDPQALYDPAARDAKYQGNWAQYMVDLHDSRATFDFCGGMMFQLVLSEKLRARLAAVGAAADGWPAKQPMVHDAKTTRMVATPNYRQGADADNVAVFHGREVRKIEGAAGGMGFAIHLSDTEADSEGWTAQELADYNGWGHDSGRPWRNLERWESEGVQGFRGKFGAAAFGLHHRFFLHLDRANRFWLSAEDGCEGYACEAGGRGGGGKMFGLF